MYLTVKYRTIENSTHTRLRRERRSGVQLNKFPLEDLNGKIVVKERRATPDRRAEGVEVTETKISRAEFQEYFEESQQGE